MKKYAVGYFSHYENNLIVDIVEAENELLAILEHKDLKKTCSSDKGMKNWIEGFKNLEEAKDEFFNGDMAIDVKEII